MLVTIIHCKVWREKASPSVADLQVFTMSRGGLVEEAGNSTELL